MSTVQEIEAAIEQLPRKEFFKLTDWISSRFSDAWDNQIEEDIQAGRLDDLAQVALAEFRAGKTTPFPPNEDLAGRRMETREPHGIPGFLL